jgi:hypothetical protein
MPYSIFCRYFHPLWYVYQTHDWSVKQRRTHLENVCISLESSVYSLIKWMKISSLVCNKTFSNWSRLGTL